jgi:multiple RNA-binding domain-containing protein 1
LAVRLAIGETQIIQENKEYFSSHGVDFDSLESALSASKSSKSSAERSTTTLLIKNLPHDVVGEELEDMFSK